MKSRCDECGATLNEDHSCPECHGLDSVNRKV